MRWLRSPNVRVNLAWLAVSFALAVLIWLAATTQENPVELRRFPQRIPIQIISDENMVITNEPTSTAQVFLRTQASVWEVLGADDITVRADVTGRAPGTYTVELSVEVANARRVVIEDWQPRQITVTIDEAAERLVEVTSEIRSQPATGFEVTGVEFAVPETLVTGPASAVERVTTALARLNLSGERAQFTSDVRLLPVDSQGRTVTGVTLDPETIQVIVNIQPGEDRREVFVTPNITGEPPQGYVVERINYEPQTVLVRGRPLALEQLPASVLTNPVDLTARTEDFSQEVQLMLPDNVLAEEAIVVTVAIGALPGSRNFDRLPVLIQGLDPAFDADYAPQNVSLFITGPAPLLDTLTASDITIFADLADLAPGSHQVPVQAAINRVGLEDATISPLPAVLEVDIRLSTGNVTPAPTLDVTLTPAGPSDSSPEPVLTATPGIYP